MKIIEIRNRAKALGLKNVGKIKKGDLIRSIQRAEGNSACFGSPGRFECPQMECCWREDCLTKNPG
jgi:hypothetical protein